jgi:tRNA-dihydrouridine synthase
MIKIGDVELGEFPLLLAPMEDVSDPPFRALCKQQGCDMMYTEFISVEGLIRDADKSVQKLDIYDYERPIGIQIFGANHDSMMRAAEIVEEAKPEVLDINYGCPVKKVVCKMAGAGILQDVDKMVKLTDDVIKSTKLPVTLSIHGRTRKQMYKGEADWSLIAKVKENPRIHIPIFGNGDIDSPQKAKLYRERYGVDGIMIGRASIGNPWIFREIKHYFKTGELLPSPTVSERVAAAKQHLKHSIEWKGEKLGVLEMRRHYTNYFRGFRNVKAFRSQLVTTPDPAQLFTILDEIESHYTEAFA